MKLSRITVMVSFVLITLLLSSNLYRAVTRSHRQSEYPLLGDSLNSESQTKSQRVSFDDSISLLEHNKEKGHYSSTPIRKELSAEEISSIPELTGKKIADSFKTSFESITDFDNFYITPVPHKGTTFQELTDTKKLLGLYSHKGWMTGANEVILGTNTNHRGYPTIQLHKIESGPFQGIVYLSLWVWLDVDLNPDNGEWFSFATLTSYGDEQWQRTLLANVGSDNILRLVHLPRQGEHLHDIFQDENAIFPMRQWAKVSMYIDYTENNSYNSPYAKLLLDGKLVSAGTFDPRLDLQTLNSVRHFECLSDWDGVSIENAETLCGLSYDGGLSQAHFGLYGAPTLESGVVYNEDLSIYELID